MLPGHVARRATCELAHMGSSKSPAATLFFCPCVYFLCRAGSHAIISQRLSFARCAGAEVDAPATKTRPPDAKMLNATENLPCTGA